MLTTVGAPPRTRAPESTPTRAPAPGRTQLKAQRQAVSTKRRHFRRAIRRVSSLLLLDAVALIAAREALHLLRGHAAVGTSVSTLFPEGFMGGWGSIAAVVVGLAAIGAYQSEQRWASAPTIFKGVAFGGALAMWQSIDALGPFWTLGRWALLVVAIGTLIFAARRLTWLVVMHYRSATTPTDLVLLVGDPRSPSGGRAAEAVAGRLGMQSVGWLSERGDVKDYLGHPSAVWEVLCDTGTDTVLLCGDLSPGMFDTVVEAAAVAGCRVLSVPSTDAPLTTSKPKVLGLGAVRLLELTFPASRAGQDAVKRLLDILVSSVLLVALSPILLAIAIWIKLDAPGPVLFVQERVGQAGSVFKMWKFRTMKVGADRMKSDLAELNESGDPRLFKITNDPRVTRSGRFLRRWSLDELPQLVNVLRGEMSLVGPRPFFESDLAAYDEHHFIRLTVKPGVTGLWQVKGRSSIVDFEEVIALDREYVENWSLGLDFAILLATFPAVLQRTGAY